MYYPDGRWQRQSLVYFGKPQDSSANVDIFPGAARVCSPTISSEQLISLTDYGANLIWELVYFTLPTREDTKVNFWAFGRLREFQDNVQLWRACVVRHPTNTP